MRRSFLFVLIVAAACGGGGSGGDPDAGATPAADAGGGDPDAFVAYGGPDDVCPGADHCPNGGDDLEAGAAVVSITPELIETEWDDSDGNGEWKRAESFTDVNGNGEFDALWLVNASGRVAADVHDEVQARALALRAGDVTVVIVYLDLFYLFGQEMDLIRDDPALAGLDIDHIVIGVTHDHSAIDTLGISAPNPFETGVDPDYMAFMRGRAAQAIAAAVADLRPASMSISQVQTVDEETGSVRNYVSDVREPIILDPTMTLVRFSERGAPETTIGTMINWASHPEYSWFDHNSVSSDFVYWVREAVEAEAGGVAVFVQGALGGQIGPDAAQPIGPDGVGSSRVDLQACKLEYSIVSPK